MQDADVHGPVIALDLRFQTRVVFAIVMSHIFVITHIQYIHDPDLASQDRDCQGAYRSFCVYYILVFLHLR